MKRKLDQLESENALYQDLFQSLRLAGDQQMQRVTELLRQDVSLESIHFYINSTAACIADTQSILHRESDRTICAVSPGALSGVQRADIPRHEVFNIGRMTDVPTYQLSATPWTSVTNDDHLVSHLISLWATWSNPWPGGVVLELFLRDMRGRCPQARFCSPFLVNCILADGCFFSDYEETRTRKGRHSTMVDLFVAEALFHFEQEKHRPSITNAQGLAILFTIIGQTNQDRLAFNYAVQAGEMCAELCRTSVRQTLLGTSTSQQHRAEMSYVLDVTTWEVSARAHFALLAWQRPPKATIPSRPYPVDFELPPTPPPQRWKPYPDPSMTESRQVGRIFQHHTKVHQLGVELAHILYLDRQPPSATTFENFLERLTSSYDDLRDATFGDVDHVAAFYLRYGPFIQLRL